MVTILEKVLGFYIHTPGSEHLHMIFCSSGFLSNLHERSVGAAGATPGAAAVGLNLQAADLVYPDRSASKVLEDPQGLQLL